MKYKSCDSNWWLGGGIHPELPAHLYTHPALDDSERDLFYRELVKKGREVDMPVVVPFWSSQMLLTLCIKNPMKLPFSE